MKEQWFDINGISFQISTLGRLRKTKTGKIMAPFKGKYKWLTYRVEHKGAKTYIYAARCMAETIPSLRKPNHYLIDVEYKDGDSANIEISNLIPVWSKARCTDDWIKVQGYDLLIAKTGELLNTRTKRIVIPTPGYKGTLYYTQKSSPLYVAKATYMIHGLGINLYDPEYLEYTQIGYLDGDRSNVSLDNLEEVTHPFRYEEVI